MANQSTHLRADQPVRWGILGTGAAAAQFTAGLRHVEDAQAWAVGSRASDTAERFARRMGLPRAHGNYEALAHDDEIDVVYIATPHHRHLGDCLMCLEAGKAVLCEKPLATSAEEARRIQAAAESRGLFCMEAMWTRFLPAMTKLRELLARGAIGEARLLAADFSIPTEFDPGNRYFSPQLGGGALLDRGVYPLSLAFDLFGRPREIMTQMTPSSTGVDEQQTILLRFDGGKLAMLSASLSGYGSGEAVIAGTTGRLCIHEPLCRPERLTLRRAPLVRAGDGAAAVGGGMGRRLKESPLVRGLMQRLRPWLDRSARVIHAPCRGNGYNYEAAEVVRCLRACETQSPRMPLAESAAILETIDQIRGQWRSRAGV